LVGLRTYILAYFPTYLLTYIGRQVGPTYLPRLISKQGSTKLSALNNSHEFLFIYFCFVFKLSFFKLVPKWHMVFNVRT
jgi:hypothetical protein